jgi:protein-tyrosine-phosphatase
MAKGMRARARPNNLQHPTPRSERRFEIALICTGNRFRSPLAEGFLAKYGHGLPLKLQSFGTRDVGPLPPLREALETATSYGLELDRHQARSLRGTSLTTADLVLGFERLHVATAVVDAGASRQGTFMLPEIVGLLAALPPAKGLPSPDRARERVAKAHELRAAQREAAPVAELPDPLGGPARGYVESASRLADLCQNLLRGLFGASTSLDPERLVAPPPAGQPVPPR